MKYNWFSAVPFLSAHRLALRICTFLIVVACVVASNVTPKVELSLPPTQIEPAGGKSYRVALQPEPLLGFVVRSDDQGKPRSKVRLLEDGIRIGKARAPLSEISELGDGRFSYWSGYLYFSIPDESDPRLNGRDYSVRISAHLGSVARVALWLIALVFIGLALVEFTFSPSGRSEKRRALQIAARSGHVAELDGVRGYACLSVLFAHCFVGITSPEVGTFLFDLESHSLSLLLGGVDLFFVLSGFLIGGILMDSRKSPHYFKRFWIRRIARIFPVLYALLISYFIALVAREYIDWPVLDRWLLAEPRPPFWTYATFLQSFPIAAGGYDGPRWVGITWSLAIEEQFYLLFPLAVFLLSRRSLLLAVLAGIIVAPVLRDVFERLYGNWYAAYVLLPSRVDGLMFGVLAAIIVRNSRALLVAIKLRRLLDVIALSSAYLVSTAHPLLYIWPSPMDGPFPPLKQTALALMFTVLILRIFLYDRSKFNLIWRTRWLGLAGVISYALYMYHQAVNGLVHGLFFNDEPRIESWPQLFASIVVMAAAIGLATASYLFMERPIRSFGRKISDQFRNEQDLRTENRPESATYLGKVPKVPETGT